jgi:hypothetical protein
MAERDDQRDEMLYIQLCLRHFKVIICNEFYPGFVGWVDWKLY